MVLTTRGGRGLLRVVVAGKRLAGRALGAAQLYHAVETDLTGHENDASVEGGFERGDTALDVAVPQLELAAPILLPALV